MKKHTFLSLLALCAVGITTQANQTNPLNGAWHTKKNDIEQVVVFVDGYLSHSTFDSKNKKFIATRGGTYTTDGKTFTVTWQYDTEKAANNTPIEQWVGQSSTFESHITDVLHSNLSGEHASWHRIDQNDAPLAGVWRITGRQQGDDMGQMPLRDRRTLKILTGKRFQWVAINVKTGEFSGTGGGTYTFQNGKYTENIEFFSRDDSRVGASLSFDGKIENDQWHHSGLSSTGNPIYEVWSKLEE